MTNMSSDSSSDSDSEQLARLSEAVIDPLSSCLPSSAISCSFNRKQKETKMPPSDQLRPSLRPCVRTDADSSVLQVTPEFRTYVATRFFKQLDSDLEFIEAGEQSSSHPEALELDVADKDICLFSTSRPGVLVPKSTVPVQTRRRHVSSSDSDEDLEQLSSVAVSGDFILQHSEIRPELRNIPKQDNSPECDKNSNNGVGLQKGVTDITPECVRNIPKKKKKRKKNKTEGTAEVESMGNGSTSNTVALKHLHNFTNAKTDLGQTNSDKPFIINVDSNMKKKKKSVSQL